MLEEPRENIAFSLEMLAREIPDQMAVIVPRADSREQLTFRQLNEETNRLASGLLKVGVTKVQKVLLMVPVGTDFIALTFALFKVGAIPTLIDPGLGRRNVLDCIRTVQPEAMIAIPLAHAARKIFSSAFRNTHLNITVGRRWFWGGPTLQQIRRRGGTDFESTATAPDDTAAILFTSGSTGPPKGVVYSHRMFFQQVQLLQNIYGIERGEIDLPTFPLFALFGIALGMTCVVPDMDPTRPAEVDPEKIVQHVHEFSVTNSFGSPALWNTVTRHCVDKSVQFPTLKRILMAGAPVPGSLLKRFDEILSADADIQTPYGATEALPVATLGRREILNETWEQTEKGRGTCVGKPVKGLQLKIIRISDDPIAEWNGGLEVPQGEIGEVIVQAPWVTRHYFNLENHNRLAKIADGPNFWHRMGDVGYLDEQGRLWFCGRKNHRVVSGNQTHFTIPCEAIFNTHPQVKRSALVGTGPRGHQEPVIVIELEDPEKRDDSNFKEALSGELKELAQKHEVTQAIRKVLFHPAFPVDIRHNAKINREQLAQWAAK
jgi:acyl-CoA synthetase (AMP-forming)/AMP-acid ligase II